MISASCYLCDTNADVHLRRNQLDGFETLIAQRGEPGLKPPGFTCECPQVITQLYTVELNHPVPEKLQNLFI